MTNTNFNLEGMSCQACATRIEKILNKNPSIELANVNFASEQVQVKFDSSKIDTNQIIALIEKAGFKASLQTQKRKTNQTLWRLIALIICATPFMFDMLAMLQNQHFLPIYVQVILASIVQLGLALPFYKGAYSAIKSGTANMDVLISLGSSLIYFYSLIMWILSILDLSTNTHLYFEANVMIITLVSLGKFIEERTKRQSLNSLNMLMQLTPTKVNLQKGEIFIATNLQDIKIGDYIRANAGDRIGADGLIVSGSGLADHSHLTGEFEPITYKIGDEVLAGALLQTGSIVYQTKQLGSQTQLGDMFKALEQAQATKAPIARLADKVAAYFVPLVVGVGLLTFLLTWLIGGILSTAIMNAVAVLVIACPCALGLATPAAIMVGMGRAFSNGIRFKDAEALENSGKCDLVVFDKTGTLTKGKPELQKILQPKNAKIDKQTFINLCVAIEKHSSHILALAIQNDLQANCVDYEIDNLKDFVGEGIEAEIKDFGSVRLGNPSFTNLELNNKFYDEFTDILQKCTLVGLSINAENQGVLAFSDALRQDSLLGVENLKRAGIEVYIMSGDSAKSVNAIGEQLGIDATKIYAQMKPRDKAQAIIELQKSGKKVAMVGDGVNDAPALAVANLSFAIKSGSAIAEHSASATLLKNSTEQVAIALKIAQATLKNIKQNLFFAFIYNLIGIPLAALGLLNPTIAATAMALSSISVILNALRLKYQKLN